MRYEKAPEGKIGKPEPETPERRFADVTVYYTTVFRYGLDWSLVDKTRLRIAALKRTHVTHVTRLY